MSFRHYRPESSTPKEKAQFNRLIRRSVKFILGGGLRYEPVYKYMQVHHSSWEPLALINSRRLFTFDSQDALFAETGRTKPCERSYIMGFMLPSEALTFVNNINIWNDDKVALICFEPKEERATHGEITVTCMFDETSGTWFGSNVMDALMTQEYRESLNEQYRIPDSLQLYAVQVFDTKWGRSASSRNGLFNAVLRALDPTIKYPRSFRDSYTTHL